LTAVLVADVAGYGCLLKNGLMLISVSPLTNHTDLSPLNGYLRRNYSLRIRFSRLLERYSLPDVGNRGPQPRAVRHLNANPAIGRTRPRLDLRRQIVENQIAASGTHDDN
jgi:hypothetical protein